MRTKELFAWIRERHIIWLRRQAKHLKPWTKDPIFQRYRFCNVYRELDTVTQWIAEHWRKPHASDPDLWFAMFVARMVNWPPTLEEVGYPVPWSPSTFLAAMEKRQREKKKVFTGAYMIRCDCQEAGKTKADYLAEKVFNPLWAAREQLRPTPKLTLRDFHTRLLPCYGVGSFTAAQVVADIKYVRPLLDAVDWYTWAASGPGSQRGLNRVMERELNAPWSEEMWLVSLQQLHQDINKLLKTTDMPKLHAQDLQNCLCEFDKYERVRLGQGKVKTTFEGV